MTFRDLITKGDADDPGFMIETIILIRALSSFWVISTVGPEADGGGGAPNFAVVFIN